MRAEVVLLFGVLLPTILLAGVDTAWVRRYDGPAHLGADATGLAVDNEGNVIVAGVSLTADSTFDWITIKYSPDGDTVWVRSTDYNYGRRKPSGLGVDGQGNIYVTGTSNTSQMVTVKYDSTGHQKWVKFYGSQALCDDLVVDKGGNVIICGGDMRASNDCVIIKYRPNGDTAWARFYDWAGYDDDLDALATTPQGDIFAAGFCSDTVPGGNILVLKYDSTGNRRWAACYDGPQHGADWPSAIAADRFGNGYVAGISDWGYGTPWDYLTIKYDSTGETLWTRRYDGAASGDDKSSAVSVDRSGNVLVAGTAQFEAGNRDYATVKYDSTGTQMWSARFDGPANALDEAHAIAVDSGGSAYVTGAARIEQCVAACVTIKYDIYGDVVWMATYPALPFTPVVGIAIVVDGEGCAYIAGAYDGDILTIKYVQNGGVAEEPASPRVFRSPPAGQPSVFSSWAALQHSLENTAATQSQVFDAMGRRVTQAKPGVYFLREGLGTRGEGLGTTRKVVLVE
jgi:hypothetical protein